jgi:glycosyltransferase involved in cell wall biosynthesis
VPPEIQQKISNYVASINNEPDSLGSTLHENIKYLPLISIITVVYNGARYLEETILSILNQSYPNIEYIVIDGGSTDGTLDIIKKYENNIDYWVSEKDEGMSDALNKGFRLATGNWFFYLNSDDLFHSNETVLEIAKSINKNNNRFDIIFGNKNIINSEGEIISKRLVVPLIPFLSNLGLKFGCGFYIYLDASFFKNSTLKKTNQFDTNLTNTMDTDLFLQFYKNKAKFKFINNYIIKFRVHETSISVSKNKKGFEETRSLILKYLNNDINKKSFIYYIINIVTKIARVFLFAIYGNLKYPFYRFFSEGNKDYPDY